MFLGHFAAGLVASRLEPRLPLGTAILAAQLPDALWPYLLLAGVESVTVAPGATAVAPLRFDHYPWSHSLVMVAAWGVAFMAAHGLIFRASKAAFLILPLCLSHWLLDAASHVPDMPVWPGGGPLVGLGLWRSLGLTLAVEGLLFAGAVFFYARGRRLRPRFWVLIAVLVAIYAASVFGPPPPSPAAIGWSMIPLVPALWWWGNRV